MVVQGNVAVVAEVVGEPGNEICIVETRQGELKDRISKNPPGRSSSPARSDRIHPSLLFKSERSKIKQRSSKNI